MAKASKNEVERIANDIVELVERNDGPVLLHELDEKVSGFFKPDDPSYSYFTSDGGDEVTFWYNMTEPGYLALQYVLCARRVTVQFVRRAPYLIEGVNFNDNTWQPIVLLPVRTANLETPNFNLRVSSTFQKSYLKHVRATGSAGYRPLAPMPVRFTADQFSF